MLRPVISVPSSLGLTGVPVPEINVHVPIPGNTAASAPRNVVEVGEQSSCSLPAKGVAAPPSKMVMMT